MVSAALPSETKDLYKVLLVDDVDLFVELEKTFFQREQLRILTASNGADVLRLARKEKPDLIFLDLYMTGMNGDEVCRQLKMDSETAQIPVIMVVQQGDAPAMAACKAACCDDTLCKPLRREDFLRASLGQLSLAARLAPRIESRLLVRYGLRQEHLLEQYMVNICTGGLFLATEAHLSIDSRLSLQIELTDGQPPLCCHGRVAWINHPDWIKKIQLPHGMGIEFIDISEEQQQRITRHLVQA